MKKIFKKFNTGFTLVELLLYMGLLSIIMVVLLQIFTAILDVQLDTKDTSFVEQDSKYILSRLAYDINKADTISIPSVLGSPSATLEIVSSGTRTTYETQNNNLYIVTTQSDVLNSLNTSISGLTFTRVGNVGGIQQIRITYTVSSNIITSTPEVKNVSTTIGLR